MRFFAVLLLLICLISRADERGANISIPAGASASSAGPWMIDNKSYISLQAVASGVVTGTFQIQVSNDPQVSSKYPVNWANLTGGSISVATSSGSVQITAPILIDYSWAQLLWSPTAATGSVSANVQLQGF